MTLQKEKVAGNLKNGEKKLQGRPYYNKVVLTLQKETMAGNLKYGYNR